MAKEPAPMEMEMDRPLVPLLLPSMERMELVKTKNAGPLGMLVDCIDLVMNEAVSSVAGLSLVSQQEEGSGTQRDQVRKERRRQKSKLSYDRIFFKSRLRN